MTSKFPFYVGRMIAYSETEKFTVKAVARVDETRGDWIHAPCLLLVQVEGKDPELCFTYASARKRRRDGNKARRVGAGKHM